MIPSMGGSEIGAWLRSYAASSPAAIVEVGSWLGAGTMQLATGAVESGAPIHCYDRWRCSTSESEKAWRVGERIGIGEDLLPRIKRNLSDFRKITFHKGELISAKWVGDPIGLYVDDASKAPALWDHAMKTFRPHFLPGIMMVLMDYHFDETAGPAYMAQKNYMIPRCAVGEFEMIEARLAGTAAAVFRVC